MDKESAHSAQLTRISFQEPSPAERGSFPFTIPALAPLDVLPVDAPVTFFVGENGSGKSTLLEAIAIATALPTVGSSDLGSDETLREQRKLARRLRLTWKGRTHRGFFLRAEDFFGFTKRVAATKVELRARLDEIDVEYEGRSELARTLARGPVAGSLGAFDARYGEDLDAHSHGESFLNLFRSRLVPGGLYLLDEPEAALSPQSQLGLIAMMREVVDDGGQFIVATHSPILLAVPGALIYSFDAAPASAVEYDALDAVSLVRSFLEAPDRYLRHLWPE